ncbi:MAG: hypothetical protein FWG65_11420 [Turicibacter sp.]|nr:hypothetical protein [Turicibacter sp.]
MYLDPGFGGMLLQVVVAIAAVGGAVLYSLRRKIRGFFSKGKGDNAEKSAPPPLNTETDIEDDAIDMLADSDSDSGKEE